jgi:prepilin-type N-terminal cleavage/methylation domain-containing protein
MFTNKTQKNNEKKSPSSRAGFTLIEMLVAVFIFSLALAAFMGIASRGLQAARYAQDEVRADYLAIEGIEVIRNIRDQALITGAPNTNWESVFDKDGCLDHLDDSDDNSCAFELDDEIKIYPCSNCSVYFSQDNGDFRQFRLKVPNSYTPTNYIRKIRIDKIDDGLDEVIVTVNVAWPTGSVEYVSSLLLWRATN